VDTVRVRELRKVFKVPERDPGLAAAVRSLVNRRHRLVPAVDGISFDIAAGEVVGFLGPNGAGKTTTLKMLSGLLHPTGGAVTVLGHTPHRRERDYLRRISLVMGNRNQLQWDIPAADSFELNRAIYRTPWPAFRQARDELVELLDLAGLIRKPVRNLSLGERMKVELAAALLHRPEVLFLDEPTLGLDVTMQRRLREFVAAYSRRYGATVLLTSHYMADVAALCERVIIIHHGRIGFDGRLAVLAARVRVHKELRVDFGSAVPDNLSAYGEVVARDGDRVTLRVPRERTPEATARLLADHTVLDLAVEEPSIEDVIEQVFAEAGGDGVPAPAAPEGAPT
jgi:ABC-2 type transport system ATP-binding protein